MRSHVNVFSPPRSTCPANSYQFLIPPFSRLSFTIQFILATWIGWLLTGVALQSLQSPVLPLAWQPEGLLGAFVSGLVAGVMVGTTQWLVLRRHIPDWLWILASGTGYVLLMTTLQAWQPLLDNGLNELALSGRLQVLPPIAASALWSVTKVLLAALCSVWLGLAQWLLLRQYARSSKGWILVPAIAVILASGIVTLSELLSGLDLEFPLNIEVLGAGILGTTQAIGLCALRKRLGNASPLSTAPEIPNAGRIRKLGQRLRQQLNQRWRNEVTSDCPLTYQVGVTETGAIVAYEATNQRARDFADLTPLPALVHEFEAGESDHRQPLARFQIKFLPSGHLEVLSWRGIPLGWLGLVMLVSVITMGVFAVRLGEWLPVSFR